MHFVPSTTSVSENYMFVAFSEATVLKYWCLPVEIFDNLDLYISTARTWSDWEFLFREFGRRAASGMVGVDELADGVRVAKQLGEHISLMQDSEEDDWATHVTTIVMEVNRLHQEMAENEIMQEETDIPNIYLHLSAIGNLMVVLRGTNLPTHDP